MFVKTQRSSMNYDDEQTLRVNEILYLLCYYSLRYFNFNSISYLSTY